MEKIPNLFDICVWCAEKVRKTQNAIRQSLCSPYRPVLSLAKACSARQRLQLLAAIARPYSTSVLLFPLFGLS